MPIDSHEDHKETGTEVLVDNVLQNIRSLSQNGNCSNTH
jgi:hypothetical protein